MPMTIAKEREVEDLYESYGVRAYEKLACYQNAVIALLMIFAEDQEELPWIYLVEFGDPDEVDCRVQTYLVYRGKVYQRGVTWLGNEFPDFHLSELKQYGRDVTFPLLGQVAVALNEKDPHSDWLTILQLLPFEGKDLRTLVVEAGIRAGVRNGIWHPGDIDEIFTPLNTP